MPALLLGCVFHSLAVPPSRSTLHPLLPHTTKLSPTHLNFSPPPWLTGKIPFASKKMPVRFFVAFLVFSAILISSAFQCLAIFQKLMLVCLGVYGWEVMVTFSYDLTILTGKRKFKYPMGFYFACRYTLFLSLLGM